MDVGRSPTRYLHIGDNTVSSQHAELRWMDGAWWVQDSSTNGTGVNGRIEKGTSRVLRQGDRLTFGGPGTGEYVLVSAEAPTVVARRLTDGHVVAAEDGTLRLPSDEAPEASIYGDYASGWWCELGQRAWQLQAEEVLQLADAWVLYVPVSSGHPGTIPVAPGRTLSDITLHLRPDRTGEHVEAWIDHEEGRETFKEAAHWNVALVLARDRMADDGPEYDRGWMDIDLVGRETGIDPKSLDTYMTRIRRAIGKAGVANWERAVEGRPHQRRLGAMAVVVHEP
jgi:hypothetical protein